MASIIDYFKANGLSYKTSCSSYRSEFGPDNALDKGSNYFYGNNYWQIYFSTAVTVGSYIISGISSWTWWPTIWKISFSNDGDSFVDSQTDSIDDLRGNTKKFMLKHKIYCKYFRITGVETSHGTNYLFFNSFDCFESYIKRSRKKCAYKTIIFDIICY